MTARMFRLTEMHQQLEEAIRREINRRAPDQLKVSYLKRRKLRIKDMLHRLTARPARS